MDQDESVKFLASDTLTLNPGDYVSPGLRVIIVDSCFPKMKIGDIEYETFARLLCFTTLTCL